MSQQSISISRTSPQSVEELGRVHPALPFEFPATRRNVIADFVQRRWHRERRRRKVGRAFDMAQEIARALPKRSRVLDVGCGNGFIAHHLSSMLSTEVLGIDLEQAAEAPIRYKQFDGARFPVVNRSIDAVVLCYVLHHAQKLDLVLNEMRRVLIKGGQAIVYEDIPDGWWDRVVCRIHDRKWRHRTGGCTFRTSSEWRRVFVGAGFQVVGERELSRWRNIAHPVKRRMFVLKLSENRKLDRE